MTLSEMLKNLMQKHQLTTTLLAKRSGVGQPVVHRILTGELNEPKITTVKKLAAAFSLTTSQFIGEEPLPE